MPLIERYFRHYIFKGDEDVLYIGLDQWIERPDNETPLLGVYVCSETEANERFDELEKDLKRARRRALAAVKKLKQQPRISSAPSELRQNTP